MIYLTCGTPGAGKTLWTIDTVAKRAAEEKREVYYFGIKGLTLDWKQLDSGRDWHKVPDHSIIVIDEAWEHFPVRKQGSDVPDFVTLFATHRHRALDVYLVTQDPTQLDTFVRKQVGEFRYLSRPHGHNYAQVWRFSHVCDWKSGTERAGGEMSRWRYPRDTFALYKSAEVHTVRKTLPTKVLLIVPLLLFIVAAGLFAWHRLGGEEKAVAKVPEKGAPKGPDGATALAAKPGALTLEEQAAKRAEGQIAYARERLPRIPDAPESAPVYDELAKPVAFPVISGCYRYTRGGFDVCKCVTQQGTPVVVTELYCRNYVAHGAFDPYRLASRDDGRAAAGERPHDPRGDQAQEKARVDSTPLQVAVSAPGAAGATPVPAKQR